MKQNNTLQKGQTVKYSRPVNAEEAVFRFILLAAPEKGKVDIQLVCDMRIKPIETLNEDEICKA